MKKLMIVVLLGMLLFGGALSCQAEPVEIWVESLFNGDFSVNDGPDADFSMTYVGMEYNWERFKIGLEYGTGELDDMDVDSWEIKAGYTLIDKEKVDLALYLSRLDISGDGFDLDGTMVGADLKWYLTKRSTIIASVGYSLDAEFNDQDDLDVWTYKIKYDYKVTDHVSLQAGYRGYAVDFDNGADADANGFFAGISFRF